MPYSLSSARGLAFVATLSTVVVPACNCVSGNPYDAEVTPPEELAPATLSGTVKVGGCAAASGVTVALFAMGESTPRDVTTTVEEDGAARFVFDRVIPDRYLVRLSPAGQESVDLARVEVFPGETVDLGEIQIAVPEGEIQGELVLSDAPVADGSTVIAVGESALCGAAEAVQVSAPVVGGRFTLSGLLPGSYEVRGFRSGYTVARSAGLEVAPAETGAGHVALQAPLVLHPASAVLKVTDDIGAPLRFVNEPLVNLEVLAFGGMPEMRLSTDPAFFDSGDDEGWLPYAAVLSDFELPSAEGEHVIYAQFRDAAAGFITELYSTSIVLDTTAPLVDELTIDRGALYLRDSTGEVELWASDNLSGVEGFQLATDALDDAFEPTGAPSATLDVVRKQRTLSFVDDDGAASDGSYTVLARVRDGAGNLSAEAAAVIVRDTTPPVALATPAITADNAPLGELRGTTVALSFHVGADETLGVDGPLRMEVEQVGSARVFRGPFSASLSLTGVEGAHEQSVSFRARFYDAAENVLAVESGALTLILHGRVFGQILLEGVAADLPAHGGTTVTATHVASGVSTSTTTTGSGEFALDELPAGEIVVRAERVGAVSLVQSTTLAAGEERQLFFPRLALARGSVAAVFHKGQLEPGEDHSGILVELHHVLGYRRQAFTAADGSVRIDDVPERIADEALGEPGYELTATHAGFASASFEGISVRRDQLSELSTADAPVELSRRVGDFEICAAAPSGGSCTAIDATRETTVYLNLVASNVTHVRISERSPFADPSDVTDAAFVPFPAVDASPFSVQLSEPDGRRTVFVQFKDDGGDVDPDNDTLGPVLQASVVLDRAPPAAIGAALVDASFTGVLTQVTDADRRFYTNSATGLVHTALGASEDEQDGSGVAQVRFSLSADGSSAVSSSFSPRRSFAIDPVQNLPDGAHVVYVGFCDGAGNCTAPADLLALPLVLDRVAPTTLHGITFQADTAAGQVRRDPAGAPDDGSFTTYLSSTSLPVRVGVGSDPELGPAGVAVSEVAALRVSLDPLFLGKPYLDVPGDAAAASSLTLPDVGLSAQQGTQRVYLQFKDHAGNETAIGAGNPFFFDVVLDTVAPMADVQLITASGGSSYFRRDAPLLVRVLSDAASGPRQVQLSTDNVLDSEPVVNVSGSSFDTSVVIAGAEGPRTLTARLIDVAGNESLVTVPFFRDVSPPESASFVECASCVVSGSTRYSTSALGTVVLDLFAQDNSGVVEHMDIYVDGALRHADEPYAPLFTATLSLVAGAHEVEVDFVDPAGNVRRVGPLEIVQDAGAPVPGASALRVAWDHDASSATAAQVVPDGGLLGSRDLVLLLDASGASRVQLAEDSACASYSEVAYGGASTFFAAATEGVARRVYARFLDDAGNASACVPSQSFFLDSTAPSIGLAQIGSGAGTLSSRSVQVRVDASDASTGYASGTLTAQLSRTGAFLADDGDGERSFTLDADGSTLLPFTLLPAAVAVGDGDGPVSLHLRVVDSAGNRSLRTLSATLDETVPPTPQPLYPTSGSTIASTLPTFSWTSVAGASRYQLVVRRVSDNSTVLSASVTSNQHTPTSALPETALRYEVRAFDDAGNDSGLDASFPVTFTCDATAPSELGGLNVAGGSVSTDSTPTFGWTEASDALTPADDLRYTLEVADSSAFLAIAHSTELTGLGSYTPVGALPDGTWYWRVTVRDLAGNSTTLVAGQPLVVDTTAPLAVALAPLADPKRAPVVLAWSLPADPDRVGVRLQVSSDSAFATLLLDSLQGDDSENITALLSSGTTYYARVAGEDALGNRNFFSSASFLFDGTAPTLGSPAISIVNSAGTPLPAGAPALSLTTQLRLAAGPIGDTVRALVSNAPDCSSPVSLLVDTSSSAGSIVSWTLAAGGATKAAYARFVDEAGNTTSCVSSQALRSVGGVSGSVNVQAGSSGLSITGNELAGINVVLSGAGISSYSTVTDAAGAYQFAGIPVPSPSSLYTLTFAKVGFSGTSTTVTVPADDIVTASQVTMTVRSGAISGTAQLNANTEGAGVCAADPQSSSSVVVSLEGTAFNGAAISRTESPAASGAYSFAGVPGGVYVVRASRDGYSTPAVIRLALTPGSSSSGNAFELYDVTAPSAPVIRSETESPTSQATARIAIDLASSDATAPSSNLRGYFVRRIDLPLPGDTGTPSSSELGTFALGSSLTLALVNNRDNRFLIAGVDCNGNRSSFSEATVRRDSSAPSQVQNVRVDSRDGAVVVTWEALPASERVSGYSVYYGNYDANDRSFFDGDFAAQGASPLDVTTNLSAPAQTLSGLINDTPFFVAVAAYDEAGNESALLSERAIAAPSTFPMDLRFEEVSLATVSSATPVEASIESNGRVVVVASDVSGTGARIYRHTQRDQLELASTLSTLLRPKVTLFDDVALFYGNGGGVVAYDLADPSAPLLLSNDATACSSCDVAYISNVGFDPAGAGERTHYFYAYTFGGTRRVGTLQRRAGSPKIFTWDSLLDTPSTSDFSQAASFGEYLVTAQGGSLYLFTMDSTGDLAHSHTLSSVNATAGGRMVADAPYVHVPGNSGVTTAYINAATRTAPFFAALAGGGTTRLSETRNNAVAAAYAGSHLIVSERSGQEQQLAEVFDVSGLSLGAGVATELGRVGVLQLRIENSISNHHALDLTVDGNWLYLLSQRTGFSRHIDLRAVELGSPRQMSQRASFLAEGGSPGAVFQTGGTLIVNYVDRVESYDVRDVDNPVRLDVATALALGGSFPFGTTRANALLRGNYLYRHVPYGDTDTRIQVVDVGFPSDIRIGANRSLNPTQAASCPNALPDCEEYVTGMALKEDVLLLSQAHHSNNAETPLYFKTLDVDDRHGLASATLRALSGAGIGYRAGIGFDVDGDYAYVSTSQLSTASYVCVIDVANPNAASQVGCTNIKQTNGSTNVGRVFQARVVNDWLMTDTDSGWFLYDVADPTALVAQAVRGGTRPEGLFVAPPRRSGPVLYGVLGNSSALPLGSLVGIDMSFDDSGVPVVDLLGSYIDAEISNRANFVLSGDVAVLGLVAGEVSIVKLH